MLQKALIPAIVLFLCAVFAVDAAAVTYYISPSGSDSNSGSSAAPWRTFLHALPKLRAGDTLLLKDGTYTLANNGMIWVNCAAAFFRSSSGIAGSLITVAAENERRAVLSSDGSARPISVQNCGYWQFAGIYARSQDRGGGIGGVVGLYNSHYITVRRMLLTHPNGCVNDHVISIYGGGSSNLIEENEIYDFHRHGISVAEDHSDSIIRRNYLNSRGRSDSSCLASPSHPQDRGDSAFISYPSSRNLFENNISEGQGVGYDIEAIGNSSDNRFLGNISLSDDFGFVARAREPGWSQSVMPRNTVIRDLLLVNPRAVGVYLRANKNTEVSNVSVFRAGEVGFVADLPAAPFHGDGEASVRAANVLVSSLGHYSYYVDQQSVFTCDYCTGSQVYNQGASSFGYSSQATSLADLGGCMAWIPNSSNLRGAGLGGADIGASIVYRYENGGLTSQPLWDTSSGQFPHGALVSGVNDISGASAFDVHTRLNVNANGCSLPGHSNSGAPSQSTGSSTPVTESSSPSDSSSGNPAPSSSTELLQPTGLSAQCSSDGQSVTVRWNAVANAQSYYVRIDYLGNNSGGSWFADGRDFYVDEYSGLSFTHSAVPGAQYEWWIHPANATAGIGMSSSATFTCGG